MPIHLKIETEVDDASARDAARKIQERFKDAGRDSGVVFGSELSSEMSKHLSSASVQRDLQSSLNTIAKYGDATGKEFAANMASKMEIELSNAGRDHAGVYANAFSQAFSGLASQFGISGSQAEAATSKITSGAGAAALAVGGIGLAAIGVGTELYNLGSQWDSISDTISGKTGKIGSDLQTITDSVKKVAVDSSVEIGKIGDVAGDLTKALKLTGQPLEDLTTQITNLNEITGDKLQIRDLAKIFHGFNIEAKDQSTALDDLYRTYTNTGFSVNELVTALANSGPKLRGFHLDLGEAAGLLSTLQEAGVNAETSVNSLGLALGNLSKGIAEPGKKGPLAAFLADEHGKPIEEVLADVIGKIHDLNSAGNEIGANDLGKSVFGKSWNDIGDSIRGDKLSVDDLNKSVDKTGPGINEVKKSTDDLHESFTNLKNTLVVELEPAASFVFQAINNLIQEYLITPVKEASQLFSNVAQGWHDLFGGGGGAPPNIGAPGVPGVTPQAGSGGGPALGPPGGGGRAGQSPLDIFAPTGPGGGGGGGGHPGPAQIGGGGSSLPGNQGIVYNAMTSAGFPASEWGALQNIMQHESGFNNTAQNPKSTAFGMFQFLDSTWSSVGGSKTSDPGLQAQYGMQYIQQRYGSPSAAWSFWQAHNWYAAGGPVDGPGGTDNVPARLTSGEFVVNKDAAAKNMQMLAAINNGDDLQGGGNRFPQRHGALWTFGPDQPLPRGAGPDDPIIPYTPPKGMLPPNLWGEYGPGEWNPSDPNFPKPGSPRDIYHHNRRGVQGFQFGGIVPPVPLAPPPPPPPPPPLTTNNVAPAPPAAAPDMGQQFAGSFFSGMQQGGGIGGIIGGIGNFALSASQAAGPDSVQPGQQPSSRSPGGGSSSGGAPVAAASMIADAFAPGSSALIQLATRAIKYGGQVASIGIMGAMETFLPGGTDLSDPSKSLIGRVASGIAGGQPASKNQAAQAKPPQAPPPPAGSPASGRGAGPLPGPPGSDRPAIVIQNQTIQTNDTAAYEREMSRIAASHSAGDNTR